MADIVSPELRKINMQHIKGKDTQPELYLRKLLFQKGYRYRLHAKTIPGHPDIWMKKYNTAIFVHGCFWHRHNGCKYAYIPKSREEFWKCKFERNKERDIRVENELSRRNIRYIIVWECTIREMKKSEGKKQLVLESIVEFLESKKEMRTEL